MTIANAVSAQSSGLDGRCSAHGGDAHPCLVPLARNAGSIRLPPRTSIGPLGKNPNGKEFVLEDSTVMQVWVTDYPADGFAASGQRFRPDSMSRRDTTVAGRPAMLVTLKLVPSEGAPTFVGSLFVTVDSARTINVTVSTATSASRDRTLHWAAGQLILPRS